MSKPDITTSAKDLVSINFFGAFIFILALLYVNKQPFKFVGFIKIGKIWQGEFLI